MTTDTQLGTRQERILACIRDHMTKHCRAPTIREMCRATGTSSTSVVAYHLRQLERNGIIARDLNVARGIEVVDAFTIFVGDEVLVEVDGELVLGRVVEPAQAAA